LTKTGKIVLALSLVALAGCVLAIVNFARIWDEPGNVLVEEAISSDGVFRATIWENSDSGPPSNSWLDLESRQRPSPPGSLTNSVFMAEAPWKSFRGIRWIGKRTLLVFYRSGPINPVGNSWRDVKVSYVKSTK
jgi:hypothetical protein